jgi:hypothetical protein
MAMQRGRTSADVDGDFVVLLIGMRFTRPWLVQKWGPIARAFREMTKVLDSDPSLGCLRHYEWFGRTTMGVQYWRDFESLRRFARDESLPHVEPWRRFNRLVRDSGDVGVWHETYLVRAGEYEAVYTNMPVFGLAAAFAPVPVAARGQSAAGRLGRPDEPLLETY